MTEAARQTGQLAGFGRFRAPGRLLRPRGGSSGHVAGARAAPGRPAARPVALEVRGGRSGLLPTAANLQNASEALCGAQGRQGMNPGILGHRPEVQGLSMALPMPLRGRPGGHAQFMTSTKIEEDGFLSVRLVRLLAAPPGRAVARFSRSGTPGGWRLGRGRSRFLRRSSCIQQLP